MRVTVNTKSGFTLEVERAADMVTLTIEAPPTEHTPTIRDNIKFTAKQGDGLLLILTGAILVGTHAYVNGHATSRVLRVDTNGSEYILAIHDPNTCMDAVRIELNDKEATTLVDHMEPE